MTELLLRQANDVSVPMPAAARVANSSRVASPTDGPVTFALVRDRGTFDALEPEWNALMAEHGRPEHVFQTFNWCWHWANHYLQADGRASTQLAILTGRASGRLVLILPLVTGRCMGLTELRWLGEPVSQYFDVLAAPEACDQATLSAAWQAVVAGTGADLANLRKVRDDATVAPFLARIGAKVTGTEEAPFVPLDRWASYADYEATLSHKMLKNRRRQRRKLDQLGPVAFAVLAGTDEAAALAAEAIALKCEWLADKDRISLALTDSRFASFFADAAHGRGKPAGLQVFALRAGADTTALEIAIDHKRQRFLHLAVYRPEFEKCAVGSLLLEDTLSASYAAGISTFDFLAPRHGYKMEFTDRIMAVRDFALAVSMKGRLWADVLLPMRSRAKRAVERAPAPLRRAFAAVLNRG